MIPLQKYRTLLGWVFGSMLLVSPLESYSRRVTPSGAPYRRTDSNIIQFLINDAIAPGVPNADGLPMITADSDPISALNASVASWSGVPSSSVRFAPLLKTTRARDPQDNMHVFVFRDTPEIRSIVGQVLAVTAIQLFEDGRIVDTDILFNPNLIVGGQRFSYSTNQAPNTFDLQAVATHELGHALGAEHSGLLRATMFQNPIEPFHAQLSTDDIAFVTDAYPAPGADSLFGTLRGTVTSGAGPVRGALLVAIDPATGIAVGGLSSVVNGAYSINRIPPGRYQVYAEPLDGPVTPGNVLLTDAQVTTSFTTNFFGGANSPQFVEVSPGNVSTADISVQDGSSSIDIGDIALGNAGGTGDFRSRSPSPKALAAGQPVDLVLFGRGLDSTITAENFRLLGPGLAIRPGSVRINNFSSGPGLRLTVDVAPRSTPAVASIVIVKGSAVSALSGALFIQTIPNFSAAGVVNAASFAGGGVVPGEIVSVFGTGLGPSGGMPNQGFDPSTGALPGVLGGVGVTFDGIPGPLFYVSDTQVNVQVPFEVAGRPNTRIVVQVLGSSSSAILAPVIAARPGIFSVPGGGQAIVVNQNGSVNSASSPAPPGSAVVIYATGQGLVNPPVATGRPAPGVEPLSRANALMVSIGGRPAEVLFGGLAPGFVGLLQVNAIVPSGVTPGNAVPVQITVSGVPSQAGATMAVR